MLATGWKGAQVLGVVRALIQLAVWLQREQRRGSSQRGSGVQGGFTCVFEVQACLHPWEPQDRAEMLGPGHCTAVSICRVLRPTCKDSEPESMARRVTEGRGSGSSDTWPWDLVGVAETFRETVRLAVLHQHRPHPSTAGRGGEGSKWHQGTLGQR